MAEARSRVARSALGAIIFVVVMAVPVWAKVVTGQDPAGALFSWFTPLAFGLALLPTHKGLARLILWSFAFVSVLTLVTVFALAFVMAVFVAPEFSLGHYVGEIGTGFGGLIQIACALFVVPVLLARDRRPSSLPEFPDSLTGRFERQADAG